MYLSADTPTRSVRSAVDDRHLVAIFGCEGHKVGQDNDTTRRYAALETWAHQNFAVRSVDHRWSAQDHMSVDHLAFVGPLSPRDAQVLVATGFNKWGMTNAAAAALMLGDRISGRPNSWAEVFDTNRLNARQWVADLVTENANVAKRFVGDRLTTAITGSPDDLAAGEAAVLRVGLTRVAAYRDTSGVMHQVSPVCTHFGCTVTWNTAETTWDCPMSRVAFHLRPRSHRGVHGDRLGVPLLKAAGSVTMPGLAPPLIRVHRNCCGEGWVDAHNAGRVAVRGCVKPRRQVRLAGVGWRRPRAA